CHRYYDPKQEKEREKLITQRYSLVRFHHKVSLEALFNGILQAKSGTVIRLDFECTDGLTPLSERLLPDSSV
ncbi:MAG: hypothetical protein ABFS56_28310, partial [Pseudomonadota bacterium]